jgi:hypothetical protein
MTDDTSISKAKANVENWRRGYEAALAGKTFLWAEGERTSAWRLGYRDGRALRLKLRLAFAGSTYRPTRATRSCASAETGCCATSSAPGRASLAARI